MLILPSPIHNFVFGVLKSLLEIRIGNYNKEFRAKIPIRNLFEFFSFCFQNSNKDLLKKKGLFQTQNLMRNKFFISNIRL